MIRTRKILLPLAWVFSLTVRLRNWLFDIGALESQSYKIPTISVGNITAGGTGKTPHIEYLIRLLGTQYQVAVLSRGYKRHTHGYLLAEAESTAQDIGDEPWMLKHKFPSINIAVDADRRHGISRLMNDPETRDTEIILLDDAFQHRYVKPGLNILLTECNRLITDDRMLPSGMLREPISGKDRADIVIVTKCPDSLTQTDYSNIQTKLHLQARQQLFFSKLTYGMPQNMDDKLEMPLTWLKQKDILLVTGIGNPQQMEHDLRQMSKTVRAMTFSDHHAYTALDFKLMEFQLKRMPEDSIIVTTEKDAARLAANPKHENLKHKIWILPIKVEILQNKEKLFNEKITGYVQKDFRDSRLAQSQDASKA